MGFVTTCPCNNSTRSPLMQRDNACWEQSVTYFYAMWKETLLQTKRIFGTVAVTRGSFFCGVDRVKRYVNVHLHCIVSSLKWTSKMSTLPTRGKFSAGAHACVVSAYSLTPALYCLINNHFCFIRVPFGAASQLARRWMCDSPRTGCARRLTPTYMWREETKA